MDLPNMLASAPSLDPLKMTRKQTKKAQPHRGYECQYGNKVARKPTDQ